MENVISRKFKLLILGFFLLFYILPLGFRPIFIPDESRYAEIPREMIASGDWIVPHLDGLRYFEKPVMGYWLNAISIKMFGENAFAVRFPSAMANGLSAFFIFLQVRRFSNRNFLGIVTAVVFLICFEVYGVGTFNVLDSMLAMFVTAAMTSFFFAYTADTSNKKKQGFLFPSVILGLKKTGIKRPIVRYAVCWFLFPVLFYSISKGKLLTYILPCFPPLAVLISTGLDEYFETGGKKAFNAGGKSLALLIAGIAVVLIVVQSIGFKGFKPYLQNWKWVLSVTGMITFTYPLLAACRKTGYKKKIVLYAVSPIFLVFSTPFVMPDVTLQHKTPGKFLLQYSNLVRPDHFSVG